MENPQFKAKYGSLYSETKFTKFSALMITNIFATRRLFFVTSVLFFSKWPLHQLSLNLISSFSYIVYLIKVTPFADPIYNIQEGANEAINMLISYLLLPNWVLNDDVKTNYEAGWSIIILVSICLVGNTAFVSFRLLRRIFLLLRRYWRIIQRRYAKRLGQRTEPVHSYNGLLPSEAPQSTKSALDPGQIMRFKILQMILKEQQSQGHFGEDKRDFNNIFEMSPPVPKVKAEKQKRKMKKKREHLESIHILKNKDDMFQVSQQASPERLRYNAVVESIAYPKEVIEEYFETDEEELKEETREDVRPSRMGLSKPQQFSFHQSITSYSNNAVTARPQMGESSPEKPEIIPEDCEEEFKTDIRKFNPTFEKQFYRRKKKKSKKHIK